METTLYDSLLRSSYRFLSYRPRSEKELENFLQKKLIAWKIAGQHSVHKVVERLRELGYIDDKKFIMWWVEQRSLFRPKGLRVLKIELMNKGISKAYIDEVLKELKSETPFDELDLAKKAIRKKLVIWGKLPIIEQKMKMYTFLTQRGFSSDTIQRLIDESLQKD